MAKSASLIDKISCVVSEISSEKWSDCSESGLNRRFHICYADEGGQGTRECALVAFGGD